MIKITRISAKTVNQSGPAQQKQIGHTRARPPMISLDQPGRLRVGNLMAILNISHATLYAGLKTGRYPKPDGRDGNFPYWNTASIRNFLESSTCGDPYEI